MLVDGALEQRKDWPEAQRLLATAHLGARQDDAALQACADAGSGMAEATELVQRLRTASRHALIVGIHHYIDPALPEAAGGANDALLMRKAIVERWRLPGRERHPAHRRRCTRERLLTEFDALAERARDEPALYLLRRLRLHNGRRRPGDRAGRRSSWRSGRRTSARRMRDGTF